MLPTTDGRRRRCSIHVLHVRSTNGRTKNEPTNQPLFACPESVARAWLVVPLLPTYITLASRRPLLSSSASFYLQRRGNVRKADGRSVRSRCTCVRQGKAVGRSAGRQLPRAAELTDERAREQLRSPNKSIADIDELAKKDAIFLFDLGWRGCDGV